MPPIITDMLNNLSPKAWLRELQWSYFTKYILITVIAKMVWKVDSFSVTFRKHHFWTGCSMCLEDLVGEHEHEAWFHTIAIPVSVCTKLIGSKVTKKKKKKQSVKTSIYLFGSIFTGLENL